ncbi:hypothetical protein FA13DRAFT_1784502 [Coprinellus micaceus]|uniref:Uncharacterized protein n=1 Tax=Coprinellus micaceus TaxID=71717 RepID=A0A4Y7U0Q6_COPMI|nr:hypothetical protein FA13DRAFT_1784502 [Coprinellus micaceus]
MDFDASWCTVCDTLIAPKRYNIPLEQPQPPPPPPTTKKPLRKGGLVQGTGRAKAAAAAAAKPQPIPAPNPTRYRTVIDQGPQGLYCSDDCRMADLNSSYLGRPVYPDRAPAEPVASSSKPRKYSPHALALAKQLNFPPLPDLNSIVYADDDSDEEFFCQPDEYTGGIIMAGRRIAEALPKPMKPRTSRYDPKPEVPKPIPGWTDGSNAWRASVYYNTRLHSDPTIATTTPRPRVRTTRRANAAACTEERPVDPTADLYEKFNECMSRRAESRISPASLSVSPDSPAPIRRERSFLPPHLEGKLLVPDVKLKVRSSSSASLTSSSTSSASSSSRRSVRSPLSTTSDQDLLTPLRVKRPAPEPMRSWSADNMLQYAPMKQPTRIVKKTERVVGEDGEEKWVEVEREELPQKLFLFPMARPMAPPPPGAVLPASVRAAS